MFATQLDLVAQGIALGLDLFIVGLFLKFLGMIELLLANGHEILELEK